MLNGKNVLKFVWKNVENWLEFHKIGVSGNSGLKKIFLLFFIRESGDPLSAGPTPRLRTTALRHNNPVLSTVCKLADVGPLYLLWSSSTFTYKKRSQGTWTHCHSLPGESNPTFSSREPGLRGALHSAANRPSAYWRPQPENTDKTTSSAKNRDGNLRLSNQKPSLPSLHLPVHENQEQYQK